MIGIDGYNVDRRKPKRKVSPFQGSISLSSSAKFHLCNLSWRICKTTVSSLMVLFWQRTKTRLEFKKLAKKCFQDPRKKFFYKSKSKLILNGVLWKKERRSEKTKNYFVINKRLSIETFARAESCKNDETRRKERKYLKSISGVES